jgi:hypothetical protein
MSTWVYLVTERLYDYRSDDYVDDVVAVFGTRDAAEQWIAMAKERSRGRGRRDFDIHDHLVHMSPLTVDPATN